MIKRKGLFNINVDWLLGEILNHSPTALNAKNIDYNVKHTESILISQALDIITRQN